MTKNLLIKFHIFKKEVTDIQQKFTRNLTKKNNKYLYQARVY